jgi:hypothetical protein
MSATESARVQRHQRLGIGAAISADEAARARWRAEQTERDLYAAMIQAAGRLDRYQQTRAELEEDCDAYLAAYHAWAQHRVDTARTVVDRTSDL